MSATVDEYLELIEKLVTYPTEPRTWTQLILLHNLTGRHNEAVEYQKRAAKCCKEAWTSIYNGDCERDHALFHIRHRQHRFAHGHLIAARRDHMEDPNRLIALLMVEGRWWYPQKRYADALRCFMRAAQLWGELEGCSGEARPNLQWCFNNDVWMFKTLVARKEPQASLRIYLESLQERMPQHGSSDIALRLKLIMRFGRLGNWLDDVAQLPRMQYILTHPSMRRLVRRILAHR